MTMKMVRISQKDIKPLTAVEIAHLERMAARPDSEIDLTDMPEWTETDFKSAIRGKYYRPIKRQITARVDADVLEWLKSQGRGYQSRINAILRREMLQSPKLP
jgi:uncharacterized protein (DUF4415 family)